MVLPSIYHEYSPGSDFWERFADAWHTSASRPHIGVAYHARVFEGVAKSPFPRKAVVFKSQQAHSDARLQIDPRERSGVVGLEGGGIGLA